MISTLLKLNWINLRRDFVALALTFVLPVIFFSIFAVIFGGMAQQGSGKRGASATKIIVVNEDSTEMSRRFVKAIDKQAALSVRTSPEAVEGSPPPLPYMREQARDRVRRGEFPAAVIIPSGFGATFGSFVKTGEPVEILHDPSNPIVLYTVSGLLQAAAMTAAPDILMESGLEQLEAAGGTLTPTQRMLMKAFKVVLRGDAKTATGEASETTAASFAGLVRVKATDVGIDPDDPGATPRSIVAYYAAGIGVMFLLFSMANGAGGSLLEEQERGTLERLLLTNIGMGTLLLGHWLFFALTGIAQLSVMFAWAAVVFGVDLWTANHLSGFVAMTVVTAGAASGFGIVLGTLCKSRAQLGGVSTIVILIMSALGGSMVPRFVMPDFMNTTALFTFNGWALDGYLKVFWHDDPQDTVLETLGGLAPQLATLLAMAFVFLFSARLLARRWETA